MIKARQFCVVVDDPSSASSCGRAHSDPVAVGGHLSLCPLPDRDTRSRRHDAGLRTYRTHARADVFCGGPVCAHITAVSLVREETPSATGQSRTKVGSVSSAVRSSPSSIGSKRGGGRGGVRTRK